ncbi:uncharacterized protein CLUP02_08665 [Colletotrichum lupini]|uniref:Protein-arginine deiminase C-terminal domain-containing protein n=1 Tax=Colletotrichum lupini TaxID=145971 RepID=A0A9Q8SUR7_9PEZI|nr:uncharacterized protein CLUP02_08665 [Colletotrichum lupini]UQC83171.1 hypothetical protein CLUP02_08665 [Colletotrichum lupini]
MYLSAKAVAIVLVTLQFGAVHGQQPKPMILADTNRDGIVDDSDATDRAFWTPSRGAIFLPNVSDSLKRCPNQDLQGNPISNHELASCHDASGHLLLEPSLVAPLKTIPLEVSDDTISHNYATPDAASERVRLFYLNDSSANPAETASWSFVDPEFTFNASHVQAGITLGIDGREFVKDFAKWDGKVWVHLDVHANGTVIFDVVELKVAPVLTHHHLQRVSAFVSTAANESEPLVRTAERQVFEQLRGKGVGGFQPEGGRGGYGAREINAYGNLKTILPYTSKSGVKYPAGRIIHGKHYDKMLAEATIAFLEGQELQNPLSLSLDGYSSVTLMTAHGGVRAISSNGSVEGSFSITKEELAVTVDELLASETFHEVNAYKQRHIDANLGILLAEIPILRDHVIRIPSLFKAPKVSSLSSLTETVMEGEYLLVSFSPAAINGVVLGNYYAGMKVGFVDDSMSHHHTFGEVHCGSNTFRETDVAWWE